jgi:hypothetical protein
VDSIEEKDSQMLELFVLRQNEEGKRVSIGTYTQTDGNMILKKLESKKRIKNLNP